MPLPEDTLNGSANPFPSLLLVESVPVTPGVSGQHRVYVDPADNKTKRKSSAGVVTDLEFSRVVQVVNFQTGSMVTTTATIPLDDTIPQIGEGFELMTLAITPTKTTSKLKIDIVVYATVDSASWIIGALFQDSTANALAAFLDYQNIGTGGMALCFTYYMTAGTTSSTTFRVRIGKDSGGTITFNGMGGARKLGGVLASSITITEIAA